MKKKNIIGLAVTIYPDRADSGDSKHRNGKIVSFFPEKEIITVRFKDRHQTVCTSDDLLTLKSKKMILRALTSGLISDNSDCKIMLKIYQLIAIKRYRRALQLAMNNNTTQFYCLTRCNAWISMQKEKQNKGSVL
jgi:hypothetical protein